MAAWIPAFVKLPPFVIGPVSLPFQLSLNESLTPPWFVSSIDPKQPLQLRPEKESGPTSVPAEPAPLNVTVKPLADAPLTTAPPGKPAMPLIAVWMFAAL